MPGHLQHDDTAGCPIGRDPRSMPAAELEALGHPRISQTDAIRAKCLDCCCGSPAEVRRCGAIDCALWPFRMGTNPYRQPMSQERREAAFCQPGTAATMQWYREGAEFIYSEGRLCFST